MVTNIWITNFFTHRTVPQVPDDDHEVEHQIDPWAG